jgi:hypothetical protein
MISRRAALAALSGGAAAAALPLRAEPNTKVDKRLILASDISGSVNSERYAMQIEGYVNALQHAAVIDAIQVGRHKAIALMAVDWATDQFVRVPWTTIDGLPAMRAFCRQLRAFPRQTAPCGAGFSAQGRTSISGAIRFSAQQFPAAEDDDAERIIDISGDGVNNSGPSLEEARADALARRITINGLPIVAEVVCPNFRRRDDVVEHYKTQVVGGPRHLLVPAHGFEQFERAIHYKLVQEIG